MVCMERVKEQTPCRIYATEITPPLLLDLSSPFGSFLNEQHWGFTSDWAQSCPIAY